MLSTSYLSLAEYFSAQNKKSDAVYNLKKALLCSDLNKKSAVYFKLAKLQQESNPSTAKRYLLMCLEEAPRYRQAYKLLLEMKREEK